MKTLIERMILRNSARACPVRDDVTAQQSETEPIEGVAVAVDDPHLAMGHIRDLIALLSQIFRTSHRTTHER